jgi:N-hydroxyarylamine O-acetyltransferase
VIDELLRHIGIDHRPDLDGAGLARVHRAFVSALAYDGLTAQLGEHAAIDPERLIERTLTTGRGGYCFEINTILLTLLRDLGFAVERREAIVDEREAFAGGAPTNHLALIATTPGDGARWLCDAGWGEGPLEPLPLAPGTYARGPLSWGVEREADDSGWWFTQHPWGTTPGFRMGDEAVSLDTFAPHHQRLATDPDSNFVRTLVVQKPGRDRVTTLRARTLSVKGPDLDLANTTMSSEDELAATLQDVFGIDPAALGAERTARLWAAACAQHEAFLLRPACSPASAPPSPRPPA